MKDEIELQTKNEKELNKNSFNDATLNENNLNSEI